MVGQESWYSQVNPDFLTSGLKNTDLFSGVVGLKVGEVLVTTCLARSPLPRCREERVDSEGRGA